MIKEQFAKKLRQKGFRRTFSGRWPSGIRETRYIRIVPDQDGCEKESVSLLVGSVFPLDIQYIHSRFSGNLYRGGTFIEGHYDETGEPTYHQNAPTEDFKREVTEGRNLKRYLLR
ncbi:MAG: hypothetical protein HYW24_02920 [Candidatus Aenigmarchaeota archaeon]|nr:hypothetical protein [Candidatus Aenigmarchaeota archaeon]